MTRRVQNGAVRIGAALALILAGGVGAQPPSKAPAEAGKQLAIMSRILDTRLGEEFREQVVTANMLQRGTQGFYVGGVGAMFFVDVKFAVAEPPAPKSAAPGSGRDDLWGLYERELERGPAAPMPTGMPEMAPGSWPGMPGGGMAAGFGGGVPAEPFDEAKVGHLRTALLESLAQYGKRMEALGDTDRIVVVVSGGGALPLLYRATTRMPSAMSRYPATKATGENVGAEKGGRFGKTPSGNKKPDPAAQAESQEKVTAVIRAGQNVTTQSTSATTAFVAATPWQTLVTVDTGAAPGGVVTYVTPSGPFVEPGRGTVLTITIARKDLTEDAAELAKKAKTEAYCF